MPWARVSVRIDGVPAAEVAGLLGGTVPSRSGAPWSQDLTTDADAPLDAQLRGLQAYLREHADALAALPGPYELGALVSWTPAKGDDRVELDGGLLELLARHRGYLWLDTWTDTDDDQDEDDEDEEADEETSSATLTLRAEPPARPADTPPLRWSAGDGGAWTATLTKDPAVRLDDQLPDAETLVAGALRDLPDGSRAALLVDWSPRLGQDHFSPEPELIGLLAGRGAHITITTHTEYGG